MVGILGMGNKLILGVSGECEMIAKIEEMREKAFPRVECDMAVTYEEAFQLLMSFTYDLVILDLKSPWVKDLLEPVSCRKFAVLILSENDSIAKVLKAHRKIKIRTILPREKLNDAVSVIARTFRSGLLQKFSM